MVVLWRKHGCEDPPRWVGRGGRFVIEEGRGRGMGFEGGSVVMKSWGPLFVVVVERWELGKG